MNDNEPWLPPGHAERLTVGTRVIVRSSPECRETWHGGDDGLTGTIMTTTMVEPGITEPDFGHSYAVQWGSYPPTKGHPCGLTWYAAAELEPLEDDDPDRRAVPYDWTFDGHVARGQSYRNDSTVMTDASASRR